MLAERFDLVVETTTGLEVQHRVQKKLAAVSADGVLLYCSFPDRNRLSEIRTAFRPKGKTGGAKPKVKDFLRLAMLRLAEAAAL